MHSLHSKLHAILVIATAVVLTGFLTAPANAQIPYNFYSDAYGTEFFEDDYVEDEVYEREWLRYDDNWDDFGIEEYDEYVEDTQDDWGEEPIEQTRFDDTDVFEEWDNEESFEESYDDDNLVYENGQFDIEDDDSDLGIDNDQGFGLDDEYGYDYADFSFENQNELSAARSPARAARRPRNLPPRATVERDGLEVARSERERLERDRFEMEDLADVDDLQVDDLEVADEDSIWQDDSSAFDVDGPDTLEEMDDADSYEEYGFSDLREDYDAPSLYYDATDGDSEFVPNDYGYPYSANHPAAPLFLEDTPDVELDRYYTEDWYEEDPDFDYWYVDGAILEDDDDSPISVGSELEPDVERWYNREIE